MEECLICGRPLVYKTTEQPVECVVCHRRFFSRVSCEGGHYICDDCHGKDAIAWIEAYCLRSEEKDPVAVAKALMDQPYVRTCMEMSTTCSSERRCLRRIIIPAVPCPLMRLWRKLYGAAVKCPAGHAVFGAPAVRLSAREFLFPSSPGRRLCRRTRGAWPIR